MNKKIKIKTERSEYTFYPQLGVLVDSQLEDDIDQQEVPFLNEEKLVFNLRQELTDSMIALKFANLRGIILNISEDCNFRCKYCLFSGQYSQVRTHSNKKMSRDTAQKAIDFAISMILKKKRNIKDKHFNIGFYGGEALLAFPLIKDVIAYAKNQFKEKELDNLFGLTFRLNSNGLLLTDETVAFLVQENIHLDISLDGPQEEHDKFRVNRNGEATWNTIWENIRKIKETFPNYYYKKINFLVTLHPFHNFQRIDQFFIDNPDYFKMENVRAYFVNDRLLQDNLKKQWFASIQRQTSKISDNTDYRQMEPKLRMKYLDENTPFTSMCIPGESKLFVDCDGNFHTCERVKSDLPIGNVDTGLDIQAIKSIMSLWREEIIKKRCWECDEWSICNVCLAVSEEPHGVSFTCPTKGQAAQSLKKYISFLEEKEKKLQFNAVKPQNIKEYVHQL